MMNLLTGEEKKNTFDNGGSDGMTPLHLAVRRGNRLNFTYIFEQTRDFQSITKTDIWGREVIHIATGVGNTKITETLLTKGSRPDRLDNNRRSPVDYLLQSKPDDDSEDDSEDDSDSDSDGDIKEGGEDGGNSGNEHDSGPANGHGLDATRCIILRKLAQAKPDYRDALGKTFLHIAAEVADVTTVEKLLSKSIALDLKSRDSRQRTPLHCALMAGNVSTSLTLIDKAGPDVGAKDAEGTSSLMFAARMNLMKVVERLFARAEEAEARKKANTATFTEEDKEVLAACNVADQDNDGRTVLYHAAIDPPDDASDDVKTKMAKFLVEKGCDPMAKDKFGCTALLRAIRCRNGAMANFLLSLGQGQIPTSPLMSKDGGTFLIAACQAPCIDVIPRILELWPDIINDGDPEYHQPPISWACENRYKDIVQMLVNDYPKLDVNKPADSYSNYTPLHFATEANDDEILGCLLKRDDANVGATNDRGDTPVDVAFDRGNPVSTKSLLLHRMASDELRITYIEKLTVKKHPEFHSILNEVFEKVDDNNLADEKLKQLVDAAEHLDEPRQLFELFISRGLKRETWRQIAGENPYHRAVRLQSFDVIEGLTAAGGNPETDRDNWSCLDYATRLGLNVEFLSAVSLHVEKHKPPEYNKNDPCKPAAIPIPTVLGGIMDVSPCANEGHSCVGFQGSYNGTSSDPDFHESFTEANKSHYFTISCFYLGRFRIS